MKTYNHLFDAICSFENLLAAARAAERGRRLNDHAGRFRTRVEAEAVEQGQVEQRKNGRTGTGYGMLL